MTDRQIFFAFIGLLIQSALCAPCSWCDEPSIGNDACVPDGSGWTLVRAIGPSKGSWFRETDQLRGTDAARDNENNEYNIGSFETAVPSWNQFLFVTGDCSSWLITSKDTAIGTWYSNNPRQICSSSSSEVPYTARWYHRRGSREDPWISTIDHHPAIGGGNIVYGENNFGSTHARTVIAPKQGVYVYIRQRDLDNLGCADPQPTPEPTTPSPTADCSRLDIDGYLLGCSEEFSSVGESQAQIAGIMERIESMEEHLNRLSDIAFQGGDGDGDAEEGGDGASAYAVPLGKIGYSAAAASEASKDVMLYALVIFNIGTLLGCLSCIYWMRQRDAAKQYAVVYEEESK